MVSYDRQHRAIRKQWQAIVDAGLAYCAEPRCMVEERGGTRWIPPGSRWHLSHDHNDPTGRTLLGPSHGAICNGAESARRNNPKRAARRRRVIL